MNDGPPPGFDDAPPFDPGQSVARSPQSARPPATRQAPQTSATSIPDFYDWLTSREARGELNVVLPDYVDVDQFIATAKDAAINNPKILADNLRPTLMRALFKAAKVGLRPDGREGALIPRYDTIARTYVIVFQPMVQGIIKLGRLTGAIESIRPVIVYRGEHFEIEEGDVQIYRHKVDRQIVSDAYKALYGGMTKDNHPRIITNSNDYFARVDCAYCIIRSKDGTVTKRWMPQTRINLIRVQQGLNTPWYGAWCDEMISKTIILFTTKHVDLDISNPATGRFREAMQHDLDIDFENARDAEQLPAPQAVGMIGQTTKLDQFERQFGKPDNEKVSVQTPLGGREPPHVARQGVASADTQEGGDTPSPPPSDQAGGSPKLPPAAPDDPLGSMRGKTWGSMRVWYASVLLRVAEIGDLETLEAFQVDPEFSDRLDAMRGKAIEISRQIDDAIDARRIFLTPLGDTA